MDETFENKDDGTKTVDQKNGTDAEMILKAREYTVNKDNDLIQWARYDLSALELKTLAFLMSKIKPDDPMGTVYEFRAVDYCRVRGINDQSGKNVALMKESLKALHDKSFWMEDEDGDLTLCTWIAKPKIRKSTKPGWIEIRFDEDIEKYLIGLREKGGYTQYELVSTLPMKSVYSMRLYELLKSYHGQLSYRKNPFALYKKEIDIEELRIRLGSSKLDDNGHIKEVHYKSFREFRRNVLDTAVREINAYTDLVVSYVKMTMGRTVLGIQFEMRLTNSEERAKNVQAADEVLKTDTIDGQMSIFDFLSDS